MAEKQTKKKTTTSSGTAKKNGGRTSAVDKNTVKYRQREEFEEKNNVEEKPQKPKSTSGTKKSSGKSSNTKKEPVNVFEESERGRKLVHHMMPYLLMILALFTVVCFLLIDVITGADAMKGVGSAGQWIRDLFCGLFGWGAFFVPVALALLSVGWRRAVEKNALLAKNLYAVLAVLMIATLLPEFPALLQKKQKRTDTA